MAWGKALVVAGVVLLLAGFGVGVEPFSSSANPPGYTCRSAIPAEVLVSGTPHATTSSSRAEANCAVVVRTVTWLTWTALAFGAVLLIAGWIAQREASPPDRRTSPA